MAVVASGRVQANVQSEHVAPPTVAPACKVIEFPVLHATVLIVTTGFALIATVVEQELVQPAVDVMLSLNVNELPLLKAPALTVTDEPVFEPTIVPFPLMVQWCVAMFEPVEE